MARKPKPDPKLDALMEQRGKAEDVYWRWYARLRRAITSAEKARRKVRRLDGAIKRRRAELALSGTTGQKGEQGCVT